MIVSHANYLVSSGHEVTLQVNTIDTIFSLDAMIQILPMRWKGKVGTLATATGRLGSYDAIIADIIPVALALSVHNSSAVIYFAQDYDESYYATAAQKYFIRFLYFVGLRMLKIRTISVSTGLADIFHRRFAQRSIVVENGVDSGIFYLNPDVELVNKKEGRKAVLVMSRSDHRKGFDLARSVIHRLALQSAVPFEVWSVGEKADGLPASIIHRDLGYLSGEALASVFSSADIFLYPSRHEGFPLMIVEAFACNCPVVTTDAVCFAKNSENALVTSVEDVAALTDACAILLTNPEIGVSLSQKAMIFSRSHELADTLCNFEEVLASMCRMSSGKSDER